MAQCKLNKIAKVLENRNCIEPTNALDQIQKIIELNESEMPPCTCNKSKATSSSPTKPEETSACPMKTNETPACPMVKSGSCHSPGPMTINPFFNFMRKLRETTCFNKTAAEVAKEASCKWNGMSDCEKAPYIVEAYKVSRKKVNVSANEEDSCSSMSEPKSKKRKREID